VFYNLLRRYRRIVKEFTVRKFRKIHKLIRWDNAGHWKNISTFPHHKHIERVENVEDSNVRNIDQALEFISSSLEQEE